MKRYLSFVFLFALTVLISGSGIYGADDRQPKTVTGKVLRSDGTLAGGALVTITCRSTSLTDTVSKYGNYEVIFGMGDCQQFDTVSITATLDGYTGAASKEVQYFKTVSVGPITLTPVPTSVPEYNGLSAIMAGSISLGSYILFRQKS